VGQVPQAWRIRVNQALIQEAEHMLPSDETVQQMADFGPPLPTRPPTADAAPRTYRVVYAPGDDHAAEEVKRTLK
jgi:hypothetical protein